MADNFVTDAGAGGNTYASDDITGVHYPILKIAYGALDSATLVSTSNGLPVAQQGTWNVGTVTTITNVVHVDDNSATLSIDDGAGSITVDGTVGVSGTVTVDSELTTADLDTGAGTDTRAVVGLIGSKSGGGQLIPGDATAGLKVDLGADNDVTITSGTVTTITNVVHVDDNTGSLTVDNAALSVTGGGVEATALRVTLASDSTGVLSVDDNGASLTVDGTVAVTNAGTFVVQENGAALTSLQLIDNIVLAEDAAHVSADPGVMALGVRKATPANLSGTDGDYEPFQVSAGRLWTSAVIDTALPTGSNTIGNVNPGTAANWGVYIEDAAETAGGNLMMAGAVRRDTAASSSGTSGDNSTLNTNNIGALWVAGTASTNGGWSVATGSIAATKTDIGTANTAGQVSGWYFYNPNASVAYVQFFNTQASGVTLGTTAPVYSLGIPATSAANVTPGMVGIAHSTAISIAVTTTRAGSTGPGSTVDYNIWYKQ